MTLKGTEANYGRVARVFHWLSTGLIFVLLPLGLFMTRGAKDALQAKLYPAHVTLGILLAVVTLLRVIWIFFDVRPAAPAQMSRERQLLYRGIHVVLYLFLLLLVYSGLGMLQLSGVALPPVGLTAADINHDLQPVAVHDIGSKIFILFLLAHIGGVVSYQMAKSDVLSRMGVSWFAREK